MHTVLQDDHALRDSDFRRRVDGLTLEQKVRLLTGADFFSLPAEPSTGLDRVVLSDGPAGVRGEHWDEHDPSLNVPCPTALAATWDEDLVEHVGGLLGDEARHKGVHVLLAPTLNIHRTPYAGRHFECFSEDPLLTGRIGAAYVRGVQSRGVAATAKHFVANDAETERMSADVAVDARALREVYLAPFEAAVRDAGAWALMAAYNGVNGSSMTQSPLLRSVLDGWGYDGCVMSDWRATRSVDAARGRLDLVMPGPDGPWGPDLVAAVRDGRVEEAEVDAKVVRLLRLAARVGADRPRTSAGLDAGTPDPSDLRAITAAGFVLVRNEHATLPVELRPGRRIAVIGANAATPRTFGGGSAGLHPQRAVTPLDGIRRAVGDHATVTYARGGVTSDRLPVADPGTLRRPDGAGAGLEVGYVDATGRLLATEHRRTPHLQWIGPVGPAGSVRVVLRTRLRATTTGEHLIGCSGVGDVELTVDGRPAFAARLAPAADADPIDAFVRPPQHAVPVSLTAGDEVELALGITLPRGVDGRPATVTSIALNVRPPGPGDDTEIEEAVALARGADVVVVVVGTTEEVESEGFDRTTLALPGRQDELVRRVAAVNDRTVVVVNAGAPVLLPWSDDVAAVLLTWFPGQEYGDALAEVLLGAREPGGRLPTTWPTTESDPLPSPAPVDGTLRYDESIHVGHRRFARDGARPAYWFGHGLGYTSWTWDGARARVTPDGVAVEVMLTNAGRRTGRQVVQVYATRPESTVDRPARWLVGWASVTADAGGRATATVTVPHRRLAHWHEPDGAWHVEPGGFTLLVGPSAGETALAVAVTIPEETSPV